MKKLVFLTLLLVGCQSTSLDQIKLNSPVESPEPQKSPEEIRQADLAEFEIKVNKLNNAGEGSLKACTIKNYSSQINVFYSNKFGKRLVFRVYDEYIINSVSMYLDKNEAKKFIKYIQKSKQIAQENKELENLELGEFKSGKNWVMLTSRSGRVTGFWGNEWVDRVLTPINADKITECSEKVLTHL